ncbi:MAG: T9SS type A sorting domain-containing protein [Ignavibacteriae bacterium]|nr:T9SS C-terminal target domain-containing protein [Ignavibacteriota bacterium]NOG98767.1 T9SS type A sorting domain-containing protein [Ignavibacteriota bacterium]
MLKRNVTYFLALLLLFSIFSASNVLANVFAHNVRITQEDSELPFDGKFTDGTGAAIRFTLSDAADTVVVSIYNDAMAVVRTITATAFTVGDNLIIWDGNDDASAVVPDGDYTVSIYTAHQGYAAYTDIVNYEVGIFTRGVTTVKTQDVKNFGFTYSASGGGYASGITRHSNDMTEWGDMMGAAALSYTTTEPAVVGSDNLRYSSEADDEGYVYLARRSSDVPAIYRYHVDMLELTLVDSGGYNDANPQGIAIEGTGVTQKIIVSNSNGEVFRFTNDGSTTAHVKEVILQDTNTVFWDVTTGRNSGWLYATYYAPDDMAFMPGIAAFDLNTYTGTPFELTDAAWTAEASDTSRANTLTYYTGATEADDKIYFTLARPAEAGAQGIYSVSDLTGARTIDLVRADPEDNMTQFRADVAVDAAGNIIHFENSNEWVTLISPPTGPNSYTYTDMFTKINVFNAEDIADVKVDADGNFEPDRAGETVTIVGIVNSINFTASSDRFSYNIQDATGGINITKGSETGGGPVYNIGDRILVSGEIGQFAGTTQLNLDSAGLANIQLLSTGNLLDPITLTIPDYLANAEMYESMLIKFDGVAKTAGSDAWPSGGSANMEIYDGFNNLVLRVDSDTDLDDNTEPVYPMNVAGIATQFTFDTPPNNGYQISPNAYADIEQDVAAPPSPFFSLLTPADGAVVDINTGNEEWTVSWMNSVDLNGDPLIYNWKLLPDLANVFPPDTTFQLDAATVLGFMGGASTATYQWTVLTKGAEPDLVASVDTFSITFNNNTGPEALATLDHVTTNLGVAAYNDGQIGDHDDLGGSGINWKGANGVWRGGVVWGTEAAGSVNGSANVNTAEIQDLVNVNSNFAGGFTSETMGSVTFDQVTTAVISDSAADTPYGLDVIQKTYSKSDEDVVFYSYGVMNNSGAEITNLYVGVFIDWDVDGSNYASNSGGYALDENLVYQYYPAGGAATPYYGVAALNGLAGYKATNADPASTIRTTLFDYISTPDPDPIGPVGDFRTWTGSMIATIADGDTGWVTFAIVAGDDLIGIRENANNAFVVANNAGFTNITVGIDDTEIIPETFFVDQNYPNPFNPSTTIKFGLPMESTVDLRIFDILGQQVAVLYNNQILSAGTYQHTFNASKLASGTYIYRLQSNDNVVTKKMMLLK